MRKYFAFDKIMFGIMATLLVVGIFVFLSASFSAFGNISKFKGILFNQLVLGLGGGTILFLVALRFPYETLRKHSLWFYGIGLILLLLVFIPGIGFAHGGAKRWLSLGPLSFQPVEFAKYAVVIYLAAWLSTIKQQVKNTVTGLLPFCIITGLVGVLLLLQPDTDSFLIIGLAGIFMYFISGARWRDIGIMVAIGIIGAGALLFARPYLLDRVKVFLDPSQDSLGASYQVQQQLIAVGSGKITGRGFGQGVQKFKYLPEPLGDSIFSVVGEEFGFIGSLVVIILYLLFFFRGMWVASRVRNQFGKLLVIGIVSIITFQSFYNIASAIGVLPLGGLPLIFISHGGTALAFALGAMGIVLNVSKDVV
jgi:cell division protein FtsW